MGFFQNMIRSSKSDIVPSVARELYDQGFNAGSNGDEAASQDADYQDGYLDGVEGRYLPPR